MRKIFINTFLLSLLLMPLSAEAFNMPSFLTFGTNKSTQKTSTSGESLASVLSNLNSDLQKADKNSQANLINLISALESNSEASKLQTTINNINKKAISEAEKSEMVLDTVSEYIQTIKSSKKTIAENLKSASASQKQQLKNALVNYIQTGTNYTDLLSKYKTAIANASKTKSTAVQTTEQLIKLKDAAVTINNNIQTVRNVSSQVTSIAKLAGIGVN